MTQAPDSDRNTDRSSTPTASPDSDTTSDGTTDWNPLLRDEFAKPYWVDLQTFVAAERREHSVYPPHDEVFAALRLTSYADTKVMVLGQDPYHGAGQAHGLAFSVRRGVRVPPSLQNMYKELQNDLGLPIPDHGNLERWAEQGVLLLNTTLTVRAGQAASHQKQGWETFTDQMIRTVADKAEPVVFVLWGNAARRKAELIDGSRHTIIESPHPSPFSARTGFFGSKPFSRINAALAESGRAPIDWRTDEPDREPAGDPDLDHGTDPASIRHGDAVDDATTGAD